MKKKIVSLMITALLFAHISSTAYASETSLGSRDVTTEGSFNYVNTTIYSVTLPTANCFNFVVDPQGILSATDPDNYGTDKYPYPRGTASFIVAEEGTGAYINNKSSVPIKLMVRAYVESDDSTGAPSTVNLLKEDQVGLLHEGIDNNMWLSFDITNDELDIETFVDETSIRTETVNEDVVVIEQNGRPTDADDKALISFALDGAKYKYTGTPGNYAYTIEDGETGDSVGLRIGGYINWNADWSAYAGTDGEKIIVKTIFEFERLSTEYRYAALDGRAHGVLEDTDAEYFAGMDYDEDGNPTGGTKDGEYAHTIGQGAVELSFSLGTGTKEVKVTNISMNGVDIDATAYKVMNDVITIKSTDDTVKAVYDTVAPEGTVIPIVVSTSDGQTTTINALLYP